MDENDFEESELEEKTYEEELDPNNPEHEFAILERGFQKTLAEMEKDVNAAQYAEEYSNLIEKVFTYNQEKQQLNQKISELETTIADKSNLLDVSEKLAKTDADTIDDLKNQIQQAWKMADMAHLREQMAQEVIENLRKQIKELTTEIELRNKMAQEEEEDRSQSKQRETLLREKQKLTSEVQQLTIKLNNALSYQQELERKNSAADLKINEISGKLEDETTECERQKSNKEKLESEVIDLKEMIEQRDKNILDLKQTIHNHTKQISKLEAQIFQQKTAYDKLYRDSDNLAHKQQKLLEEIQQGQLEHEDLKAQLNKKMAILRSCEEGQQHLKNEYSKAQKAVEAAEKRNKNTEIEKEMAISETTKLRQQVFIMEREVVQIRKNEQAGKRDLENFAREREIMSKNLVRCQAVTADHVKLIKLQEQTRRKLEAEIDEYKIEGSRQAKLISSLERERDRLAEEGIDLTNKIETLMDDIRFKKDEIYELKKAVAELESRLRMQENLFETIRAERNGLQKTLQETASEISDLKAKLKIVNHQTEQLKEDIATKEQMLIKEETILRKVNKEKETLIVELNNASDQIKSLKYDLSEMTAEEKRLHKVILESERTIRQQTKDLEQLMNERDILGSQLVRRNDELALLYEKIRILQTTLHRGEAQYAQRLEDIRLLKIEIKRLRQEKQLLNRSVMNSTDLRQEIFHLDRDLTRERLKVRALEEEICNPLNVHRWRQLEGTDPNAVEMLQKIQILQKRVLKQLSIAVERERKMKEMERMYLSLKAAIAKQPGVEIQQELLKTQRALTSRKNKMKCLVSELNMSEQLCTEYKLKLEKTQEELTEFKKRFLAEKRSETKRRNVDSGPMPDVKRSSSITVNKFTGGGFKMS